MILAQYLNRQVLSSAVTVLGMLLLIFMGQRFVQNLADAAQGKFASELVLELLWLQLPVFISYLLPLSLFIGMLITLSRLYSDHEMAILKSCGVGEFDLLKMVLPLGLVTLLLTGYMTLGYAPQQLQTQQMLINEQRAKGEFSVITEGKFQQTADGKRILYVESLDEEETMNRVFLADLDSLGERTLLMAEQANFTVLDNQSQFLKFSDGHQYKQNLLSDELQVIGFSEYQIRLKPREDEGKRLKIKALDTAELIATASPEHLAELHWRMATPISVILLLLLSIPLSETEPRQGKFAKLLPAFLFYILYVLLLAGTRNLIEDEKVPFAFGVLWVHVIMAGIVYSLYTKWRWLKLLKTRLRRPAAA